MEKQQKTLCSLDDTMSCMKIRLNDIAEEQGSSGWLKVLPIKWSEFSLSKSDLWDDMILKYGLPLKILPGNCGCLIPYNYNTQYHARKRDS